ncbi:hypothetical protein P22_0195 [Propionispora sp. 2/2-37]|uniref:ComEA family DNA-binding protein n=1 Tax=Propionispora sp. 2/2-37 TaxID=1677858 RepID=UPI0006BB6DE9|nr:ComEA family DNA-binding protein [Propionispora sp. 2/2-37]CUH94133.1 hypothetical protein P22_0195 [Propionispora sp. 2/2-37]
MLKKERIIIILAVAAIILIASFYSFWQKSAVAEQTTIEQEEPLIPKEDERRPQESQKESVYVIYVSGAVTCPGVYEVPASGRVLDAVNAAGGLTPTADQVKINLAEKIRDGMHIHVLQQNSGTSPDGKLRQGSDMPDRININQADKEELDKLPGIGPAMAERIIEYRETVGSFQDITDLKKVPGIGEAKYNRIVDKITI